MENTEVVQNNNDRESELKFILKMLRFEDKSWFIGMIVYFGLAALCLLMMLVAIIVGIAITVGGMYAGIGLAVGYGIYFFVLCLACVACGIVGIVVEKKTKQLVNNFENDTEAVIKRNGSAGTIVLAAFFNTIAMIFIIINFVKIRNLK